ncbi:MAG: hypothetical protein K6G68_12070 [Oscillospiraceae bacterium]|nr:hypothetical protein [Oscillospiraceae bacterium]
MKKQIFLCALLCITLCSCSSQSQDNDAATPAAEQRAAQQNRNYWDVKYWTGTEIPYISTSSNVSSGSSFWSDKGADTLIEAFDKGEYSEILPLTYQLVCVNASPDCQFILYLYDEDGNSVKNNTSSSKYYDVSILLDGETNPSIKPSGMIPPAADEGNPDEQCMRLIEDPEGATGTHLMDALSQNKDFSVLIQEKGAGTDAYYFEVNGRGFSDTYASVDWSILEQ